MGGWPCLIHKQFCQKQPHWRRTQVKIPNQNSWRAITAFGDEDLTKQGTENYHIITDSLHWQNSWTSRTTGHKLSHYTNWSEYKFRIWRRRTWSNDWWLSIRHICESNQIINACSFRDTTQHCICHTHTGKIYESTTAKALDNYEVCFPISQGDAHSHAYLWWIKSRMEAGNKYVLWYWLGIEFRQEIHQQICIPTCQQSCIMELKEASNCCIINSRGQIHCCYPHCQANLMASIAIQQTWNSTTQDISFILGQSSCHRYITSSQISCSHETHRHCSSFLMQLSWIRHYQDHLYTDMQEPSRCIYKRITEAVTSRFNYWNWSNIWPRGIVGIVVRHQYMGICLIILFD